MPPYTPNSKATQHLVIMVKEPRMGTVKTRLSKDIGYVAATAFYRRTTNHIIQRLSRDPRWQTHIAIAPDTAINLPFWPSPSAKSSRPNPIKRSRQGFGDLGDRMHRQFKNISRSKSNSLTKNNGRTHGQGPILIIGTDIPEITTTDIATAFKQLNEKDALIGPSGDGGYWIIGQKRSPKLHKLFKNVRWSTEHTYNDTHSNLASNKWAITKTLSDVDTGQEFKVLNHYSRRLMPLKNK